MPDVPHIGGLELDQDLEFQQASWTVQRVGWAIMALVIVATLLGLFGPGPFSKTTLSDQSASVWMTYHRFVRYQAPAQLRVHLRPEGKDMVRLWFRRAYIESFQVQYVTPPPERVEAGPERLTYIFRVSDPQRATAVTFHLEPEECGPHSGYVGLENHPPLRFSQFVYP